MAAGSKDKGASGGQVDKQFEELQKSGKNDKGTLLDWLKRSALDADEKLKELFEDVVEKDKVDKQKFRQVLETLAERQGREVEALTELLAAQGPPVEMTMATAEKAVREEFENTPKREADKVFKNI